MTPRLLALAAAAAAALGGSAAQPPAAIDFQRDVQPIFREHCFGCHGPTQQLSGFRLDRRADAMRGGITDPTLDPGNADGSRLYHRVDRHEPSARRCRRPGRSATEQIAIIRQWIDEGANGRTRRRGETPAPPADPDATRLMTAIRNDDRRAIDAASARPTRASRGRAGAHGSTPLMAAALYGDARAGRSGCSAAGADPNAANSAGATALMWAAPDRGQDAAAARRRRRRERAIGRPAIAALHRQRHRRRRAGVEAAARLRRGPVSVAGDRSVAAARSGARGRCGDVPAAAAVRRRPEGCRRAAAGHSCARTASRAPRWPGVAAGGPLAAQPPASAPSRRRHDTIRAERPGRRRSARRRRHPQHSRRRRAQPAAAAGRRRRVHQANRLRVLSPQQRRLDGGRGGPRARLRGERGDRGRQAARSARTSSRGASAHCRTFRSPARTIRSATCCSALPRTTILPMRRPMRRRSI